MRDNGVGEGDGKKYPNLRDVIYMDDPLNPLNYFHNCETSLIID